MMNSDRSISRESRNITISSIVVFVVLFAFYYFYNKKLQMITFDTMSMFPMLDDWLTGNIFLKGWIVGAESFVFTDTIWCLPLKILGVPVVEIAFINGAISHAAYVAVTLYLLIKDSLDRQVIKNKLSIIVFGIIYVLLIGTIPCVGGYEHSAAYVYLNINQHTGAYLLIALEMLLMYIWRSKNYKGYVIPVVFTITGILGLMSDTFPLLILYAPLIVYSVYSIVWPKLERNNKVYIFYIASSVFIAIGSNLINKLVAKLGGMDMTGVGVQVSSFSEAFSRAFKFAKKLVILFGYDTSGEIRITPYIFVVGIILLSIAIAVIYQAVKAIKGNPDRFGLFLAIAIVGNVLGCMLISTESAIWGRYLLSVPFFGYILVVKMFIDITGKKSISDTKNKIITISLLALSLVFCVKNTIDFAHAKNYGEDYQQVAQYITEHNLGDGYAGAWISYPVSSYTDFDTMLYPIYWYENSPGFYRWKSLCKLDWFDSDGLYYVVVFADSDSSIYSVDSRREYFHLFAGEPEQSVVIGDYEIMIYDYDLRQHLLELPE